jgi:hypothetical protein
LNSWIYTTNHKRISVNYFNFVLLAGTAGMSLATIIRSEFSYPGVGILAGDSLQYLSIATAHGVIMVFYMIMPLIFGAFGNFLLPTQLGVHDVAFPRLNSAAFWFLPGGLIMLMQLVCVDRRYQRMNCFNIRELQGILKRRFFTDMVNSSDHRDLASSSMIGIRFKGNNNFNLDSDVLSFYRVGTTLSPKSRFVGMHSYYSNGSYLNLSQSSYSFEEYFTNTLAALRAFLQLYIRLVFSIFNISLFPTTQSFFHNSFYTYLIDIFSFNFRFSSVFTEKSSTFVKSPNITANSTNDLTMFSGKVAYENNLGSSFYLNSEKENLLRFSRFTSPTLSYDYKCGHYIGIWDKLFPSLMTSFIEVARGIKKSP